MSNQKTTESEFPERISVWRKAPGHNRSWVSDVGGAPTRIHGECSYTRTDTINPKPIEGLREAVLVFDKNYTEALYLDGGLVDSGHQIVATRITRAIDGLHYKECRCVFRSRKLTYLVPEWPALLSDLRGPNELAPSPLAEVVRGVLKACEDFECRVCESHLGSSPGCSACAAVIAAEKALAEIGGGE